MIINVLLAICLIGLFFLTRYYAKKKDVCQTIFGCTMMIITTIALALR